MRLNKIIQRDYTSFSLYYQIKLPLDLEISIPSDDPVRLVSAFVEEMDLSELYKTYGRIRKNQATPRQMLKLVIYAAMNRIYSSRDIRKACKRDINFMYLLEGVPAPDHATIARFISLHFSACAKALLAQMSDLLYLLGEISGKTIFIDGTKIESAANKYTFVWKKAITKNQVRLYTKLSSFVAECEELYGIKTVYHKRISIHTLKRLKKQLCRVKVQEGIVFVHGIGRRKTQLQKSLEQLDQYLEKLKEYTKKLYTLGDRNSYSKTDLEATFMRMKEDHMLNGQLKPAYNVQIAVENYFIVHGYVSSDRTDYNTLIPVLEKHKNAFGSILEEVTADSGYCSEKNLLYLKRNEISSYIKLQDHEKRKTRAYSEDISKYYNMRTGIFEDEQFYICHAGRELRHLRTESKEQDGYTQTFEVYGCADCSGCEHKARCLYKYDAEKDAEKNKVMKINQQSEELKERSHANIQSERGILKRQTRSIQTEGHFGDIKENENFRRFNYRSADKVYKEFMLYAIGRNINKYHRFLYEKLRKFEGKTA